MSGVSNACARAWVEVDLDALRANFLRLRERAGPGHGVLPVVKADAYGLGATRVLRELEPLEPWGFGVATAEEGASLRAAGYTGRVLVVAPLTPGSEPLAAAAGLTPTVSDTAALDRLAAAVPASGPPLAFHVDVDTGMGRSGFPDDAVGAWAPAVAARGRDGLRWTGICTHLYGADEGDAGSARAQWLRFQQALAAVRAGIPGEMARGVGPVGGSAGSGPFGLLVHVANSAAAARWPEFAADIVRSGYALYGGWPAGLEPERAEVPRPEPVVSVRARIALVRRVPAGATVGYGATHSAPPGGARWATVAIGYGDGLPRRLGNRGRALVRGASARIVGRVSMDLTVVDVSDIDGVEAGEVVTLLGRDGGREIPLAEVARHAGTIGYEILTGLGARLPRTEVSRVGGDG
ncbi:MAG TPA: alanine racemase [Longimicrobiales bacterium]|nr:alanine racemase [Longimicrobiales bacterium]